MAARSNPIAEAIATLFDRYASRTRGRVGTVTGTSGTKVVVTVDGNAMTVPRLASYTPVVGEIVHIDCNRDGWLVLGRSA